MTRLNPSRPNISCRLFLNPSIAIPIGPAIPVCGRVDVTLKRTLLFHPLFLRCHGGCPQHPCLSGQLLSGASRTNQS